MNTAVARPTGWTVLAAALMTLPLLLPGARKKYGTIPVVLGAIGLAQQVSSWRRHRRAASLPPPSHT